MRFLRPLLFLLSLTTISANASLLYSIDQGSTIYNRSTGQTEELFGSFSIEMSFDSGSSISFSFLSLNFYSDSITYNLYQDNNYALSVFHVNDPTRCLSFSCATSFAVEALTSGLPVSSVTPVIVGSDFGDFEGDIFAPTRFVFNNLQSYPSAGGLFMADLSFSATLVNQVPTPGSIMLIFIGFLALIKTKTSSLKR